MNEEIVKARQEARAPAKVSISREAPLASQGFWKVPSPVDPSGQSSRGLLGSALGVGAGVGVGVGAGVAAGFADGAVALACSCSQPDRTPRRVSNAGNVSFALHMAASTRSAREIAQRRTGAPYRIRFSMTIGSLASNPGALFQLVRG